jgi:hypothetical protein
MRNFGEIKTKLLSKITESYSLENKKEVRDLIKKLQSNKNLSEMYVFYEDMEKLTFSNKEKAELFVESLEPQLIEKHKNLKTDIKEFSNYLGNINSDKNELYSDLDILSEENTIHNISKKIDSRERLINHLIKEKKKEKPIDVPTVRIENHSLLNTVLVNNFNIKYEDFLNEEQKEIFKKIVSLSNEELISEINSIKNNIDSKLNKLINETTDIETLKKLNEVKIELSNVENSKYQYFKLIQLNEGLV